MLQKTLLMFASCISILSATAQNQKPSSLVNTQPALVAQPGYNYKKLNPQLSYAFIVNKPTTAHPQEGDQVSLVMQSICNNRSMYSTYQAFKGKPGVYAVTKPAYKGDIIEAIMLMTPGDSIVCLTDADALFKNSKTKLPDFIKAGDKVQYFIKLVSVKNKEQVQKEQQAAFMKQMKEQEAKQKAAEAKQMLKDDKTLKSYFTKNNITPVKTASGLYYSIKEEGSGEKPMPGDSVAMVYTGKFLNGTKFDSNEDTAFHGTAPFQFILGRGMVIKGWDEGVALLKTGSKASFYIPSPLAYGQQTRPGSGANPKGIPANSILMFDVQLVSSKHPAPVATPAPKTDSLNMLKVDTLKTPQMIQPALEKN
jgi:FKBP-type peptidyl-prolyl cis-trans isomerase